jgi:CRP-like cAMP-binding protein
VLFLKRADVFGELPGEVLLALARNASEIRFEPSAPIVQAGDPGSGLFVVVSGEVAVERGGAVIALLGPGSCFGELALLDGQPRSATVRAQGEVACLGLGRDAFLDLVAEEPELARGLLAVLTRRLRGMIERSGAVY